RSSLAIADAASATPHPRPRPAGASAPPLPPLLFFRLPLHESDRRRGERTARGSRRSRGGRGRGTSRHRHRLGLSEGSGTQLEQRIKQGNSPSPHNPPRWIPIPAAAAPDLTLPSSSAANPLVPKPATKESDEAGGGGEGEFGGDRARSPSETEKTHPASRSAALPSLDPARGRAAETATAAAAAAATGGGRPRRADQMVGGRGAKIRRGSRDYPCGSPSGAAGAAGCRRLDDLLRRVWPLATRERERETDEQTATARKVCRNTRKASRHCRAGSRGPLIKFLIHI
ncbi:hypothetical protein PVAP13_1NG468219, partial [Panicum virgatum]